MQKVEAIIRSDKLEDLKDALAQSELHKGMTISQVLGYGQQLGLTEYVRGQEVTPTLLAKVKVEIVVADTEVAPLLELIKDAVWTGETGDGKVFVIPVSDVIRIRTGEYGGDAL